MCNRRTPSQQTFRIFWVTANLRHLQVFCPSSALTAPSTGQSWCSCHFQYYQLIRYAHRCTGSPNLVYARPHDAQAHSRSELALKLTLSTQRGAQICLSSRRQGLIKHPLVNSFDCRIRAFTNYSNHCMSAAKRALNVVHLKQ